MATSAAPTVYAHIVKQEGYCGGKAAIGTTRVRVADVAFLDKVGKTPAQIVEIYPFLTLAQVHAALTYYFDHRDEIEAVFAADEKAQEEGERLEEERARGRAAP